MVVLDFMGLTAVKDAPVQGLPYGTLKMCETAAVIATDPEILMLDEPLAGTGPEEGEEFCQRLKDMRRDLGISIVMIEHHVPLVLSTADYIYVLNFGALLAQGLPDEHPQERSGRRAYMGEGATALPKATPAPKETLLLDVRDLRPGYGALPVLHGISFQVSRGETAVLLGLNGAGKSTTVLNLCGALRAVGRAASPSTARTPPKWSTARVPSREGIVLVPEGRRIFPDLNVEKNLQVGSWTQRSDATWVDEQRERVYDYLPRLRERRDQMAGTLSGGEQQMLAIGRGLMAKPKLLIIDEASLGLAPVIVKEVFKIVSQVNDDGVTVILVEAEHQRPRDRRRRHRVPEGRDQAEVRGEQLKDATKLRELYMG